MKEILLSSLSFVAVLFGNPLFAQPDKSDKKETEEIVIRNKGEKDMKLEIKIDGDNIIVNGKPLAEFNDNEIKINKKKIIIRDGDDAMNLDFGPGRSFSFNSDDFKKQWKNFTEEKKTFLGVVTEKADGGVKVEEVVKGSAAEKAGLKKGDIITKIDNDKIENPDALSGIIRDKKPGDEVKIYYKREGKNKNLKATLEEHAEKRSMAFAFGGPNTGLNGSMAISPEDLESLKALGQMGGNFGDMPEPPMPFHRPKKLGLKIQDTEEGGNVKVINVEDSSAADIAGIKQGDLITEIDGDKIDNTDIARDHLHPEEGKTFYKIKVLRDGKPIDVEVKIPKKLKTANL